MKKIIVARIVLSFAGILIWGYGQRIDDPNLRLAGMGVLAVALLLRFVPKRWFEDGTS